jgi:hypothetical protein
MRIKRSFFLTGLSVLSLAGFMVGLVLTIRHEPGFYHRVDIAPGKARQEMSGACLGWFSALFNNFHEGPDLAINPKGKWEVTILEAQINSFFAEDFIHQGLAEVLGAQGITEPRIALENDKLRLAFRYGTPPWSTIISYDIKLWLAPKEVNVICVEFLGRHSGALPITTQSLLNDISEAAGQNGFEVSWYRHNGNPVALVRIQQKNRPLIPTQLRRLDVKQGWLAIGGLSQDPSQASNSEKGSAPAAN